MSLIRTIVTSLYLGQRIQNVMVFDKPDFITADLNTLCQTLRDQWVFRIKQQQNAGFAYQNITAQKIEAAPAPPFLLDILGNTGALAGNGYHPSVAMVYSFRTHLATKAGRGRIYIGGIHGESILNGQFHPTVAGSFALIATQLTSLFAEGGSNPFHLMVGPRASTDSTDYKAVVQIIARPICGIQRRRNINVGV
jgi:hypothetical protein